MLTSEQIAQNIENILSSKRISNRNFLKEAGLSQTTIANMKAGSMPSADKLAVIAESLGVSLDYLMDIKKDDAPDSKVRSDIVDKVRQLSDSQAEHLLAILESMVE